MYMAASPLLNYSAEGTLETRLNTVEAELATLPTEVVTLLEEFTARTRHRDEQVVAEHHTEVSDRRRRCCLYLTHYTVGGTRYQGAVSLIFKQALAAAGYEMAADELPDYLLVVLELSVRSGDEVAGMLLSSHRKGIGVLRSALTDAASLYTGLVEAISIALPRIDEVIAKRIRALVTAELPIKTVGVTSTLPFPIISACGLSLSDVAAVPGSAPVTDPSPSQAARRA